MQKKRLDSWKAIAEFLGRSLRTVQRWHDLNGLPVHHFGGNKGSVFAYEEEIDAWLAGLAEGSGVSVSASDKQVESDCQLSRELTFAAKRLWETRSVKNIQTIADLYHRAIDNDSTNAAAFAGLANAMIFSAMNEVMDGAIAFPIAQDALRRISAVNSDCTDAKCPAAWLDLLCHHNWHQAHAGFEEAARVRPSSSFARAGLAMSEVAKGNLEEAKECMWEAWRLTPLVRSLAGLLCWVVYLNGEFDRVLDLITQMKAAGGSGPLTEMIEALVIAQDSNTAKLQRLESIVKDQPQNPFLQGLLGYEYGKAGEECKARAQKAQLAHRGAIGRRSKAFPLALVSLGLHEDQDAVSWLEACYAEGSLWFLGFRSDPILRELKGQPRFEQLLRSIGAPRPFHAESEISTYVPPGGLVTSTRFHTSKKLQAALV